MDPYRTLNKEKKLPFNFKMWCPIIGVILTILMIISLLGVGCHAYNKYQTQRSIEIKLSNEKFTSFMEAKCSPGFYIETKNVRDDIYRLKCSLENGKENEIVIKYSEEK